MSDLPASTSGVPRLEMNMTTPSLSGTGEPLASCKLGKSLSQLNYISAPVYPERAWCHRRSEESMRPLKLELQTPVLILLLDLCY